MHVARTRETDRVRDDTNPPGTARLLIPATVTWAITAWAVMFANSGHWVCLFGVLLGTGALITHFVRQSKRCTLRNRGRHQLLGAVLVTAAALVLTGLSLMNAQQARESPTLTTLAEAGLTHKFDATLTGYPETRQTAHGTRYWVRANLSSSGEGTRARAPALLWLADRPESDWGPGLQLKLRGTLEKFEPARFDAFGLSVRELTAMPKTSWFSTLSSQAAHFRELLVTHSREISRAALVPGFAVGDTSLITDTLEEAMRESSLSHLVAVSGANCALITTAVMWLLGVLWAPLRLRIIFAVIALAAFVVIVGPDASVQRAAVMAAVLLTARFGAKRAVSLPALGAAMLTLLIMNPWQALHPGFGLSVSATAGILLLARPCTTWLHTRLRLPHLLALPIAVAVAAQFACGPLLLFLQPGIPVAGVLANVIAAPAAPLGTGLGLLAAVILPMSEELGVWLIQLAALAATWVEATASVTISLPGARWHWPGGWGGVILLSVTQLLAILAWALRTGRLGLSRNQRVAHRNPWEHRSSSPTAVSAVTLACGGLAFGLFLGVSAATPIVTRLATPTDWVVVACDVGQGDAMLIRDPALPETVMLVDTGDDEELLIACLDRFQIQRISLLVLSHDDSDHVAALPAIINRVDKALIAPPILGETHESRAVVKQLTARGIETQVGAAGLEGWAAQEQQGWRWEVFAPSASSRPPSHNGSSLVMTVDTAGVTLLLLGDTGKREQQALRLDDIDIDVVKVAHHGSRDQDATLARRLGAQWALISVGAGNRHGHPADSTVQDLLWAGTRVLRTDENGTVALLLDADGALVPWAQGERQ